MLLVSDLGPFFSVPSSLGKAFKHAVKSGAGYPGLTGVTCSFAIGLTETEISPDVLQVKHVLKSLAD